MLILRQSTSIDIRMGPFVDATDGVTPETGVTLGAADQAEVLKADGAATSAMAGTFAAVTGADGWYDYTCGTGDVDTVGEVVFVVQDSSVCLPVMTRAYVLEEAAYDFLFASGATPIADINAEVDTALSDIGLDHLLSAAVTGTDVTDNSVIAQLVSSSATADWDTFDNTTDSLQSLRDRGDAAWTTGGGGSITDLLNVIPIIPSAIDLANTKSWRLGFMLTNALDDLPSTAEITPGTVSIDRAAQGSTTWTSVVTDSACSEIAGMIYFDEVFDTATGYAAGDSLRFTFKSQSITVSANDYEITDGTNGRIFYSNIIADTPDVNVAQVDGVATGVDNFSLFVQTLNASGQIQAGSLASAAITSAKVNDGALTAAKFGTGFITAAGIATDAIDADAVAADAVTEIQSGLATSAEITALDTVVDRVEADTQDIQSRLPAALNNGAIVADIQRINDIAVVGDGSATPFTV